MFGVLCMTLHRMPICSIFETRLRIEGIKLREKRLSAEARPQRTPWCPRKPYPRLSLARMHDVRLNFEDPRPNVSQLAKGAVLMTAQGS